MTITNNRTQQLRKQPPPREHKRKREQRERLDRVFEKQQSCDVDPLDAIERVYVLTDIPER